MSAARLVALALALCACVALPSCSNNSEAGVVDAESGFDTRPAATKCHAPPLLDTVIEATRLFPDVRFEKPTTLVRPAATMPWYVLEITGRILRVSEDTAAAEVFADLSDVVSLVDTESGLLGIAFSTQFATTGELFLSFTAKSDKSLFRNVVSRFRSHDGGRTLDRSSEQIVLSIERDEVHHHGGRLEFGPDGYLYVGFGDGSFGDPNQNAQNLELWLGKVLRIDVLGGLPYAIPKDNPFANGGGRPEIYARGFRNPWSFSFDEAGTMWLADVGQLQWEEIDHVASGGNYGWPLREGAHCFLRDPCEVPGATDPIYEYPHVEGFSITGGFVYRGTRIPSLRGRYIFGDFITGQILALEPDRQGARALASIGFGLASFAEGPDHELYVIDFDGGGMYRLDPHEVPPPSTTSLAALGCLNPNDPARMAAGLIPYDVNAPLWADGLDKERWLAIPDGTVIAVEGDGDWTLPPGSLALKTFSHRGRRIETRMLARDPERGWIGHTFEWNDAQTDAVLLDQGKSTRVGDFEWQLPSRAQCFTCHTSAAGRTLGLETAQLNRTFVYPTQRRANQVTTFSLAGLLDRPIDAALSRRLADPSLIDARLEDRARAYLHANCSSCHQPLGPGRGIADLRASADLTSTGLLCQAPYAGDVNTSNGLLLAPGEPERSILATRMQTRGPGRMPPLGSSKVDDEGAALVARWIMSVSTCE